MTNHSMPNAYGYFVSALIALVALTGCGNEASKACFEGTDVKQIISACGELCDKDDGEACAKQDEVAQQSCFKEGESETCRWMCDYAKIGQDLYCAEYTKITGKSAE